MKHKITKSFSLYVLAALASALSDFLVFITLVSLKVHYIPSQCVSRVVGGVVSFVTNKNFSFKSETSNSFIEIRRFLFLYVISYLLSIFNIWFIHNVLNTPVLIAKIITDGLGFIINFILMRIYVFANVRGIIFHLKSFFYKLSNDLMRR
jgi:putative flippase GtrA